MIRVYNQYVYDFEKFPVYLQSEKIYRNLLSLINNNRIPRFLRLQLDRASTSITLNIAEGAGKYSRKDKKNFYTIARASAQECVSILRILKIRNYIGGATYKSLYDEFEHLSKMLSGLINSMIK